MAYREEYIEAVQAYTKLDLKERMQLTMYFFGKFMKESNAGELEMKSSYPALGLSVEMIVSTEPLSKDESGKEDDYDDN